MYLIFDSMFVWMLVQWLRACLSGCWSSDTIQNVCQKKYVKRALFLLLSTHRREKLIWKNSKKFGGNLEIVGQACNWKSLLQKLFMWTLLHIHTISSGSIPSSDEWHPRGLSQSAGVLIVYIIVFWTLLLSHFYLNILRWKRWCPLITSNHYPIDR